MQPRSWTLNSDRECLILVDTFRIVYLYDAKYGAFPQLDHSAAPQLLEPQDDPTGMQSTSLGWSCRAWK
jgi:hypothetical protein